MRFVIPLLFAAPAYAWEFTPSPVCTLAHTEAAASVTVTYDHATALYAISITTPEGWPEAPAFSVRFEGQRPNTISTRRHTVQGNTLTVSDAGFGNVLDGLAENATATAFTETAAATVSLAGASAPVAAFRACVASPSV